MLVNVSLHRVIEQAKAFAGKGVLMLDLIQEGSLGLWESVLRYEEGDFEHYSDWWIRQYMAKALVQQARSGGVGQKIRRAAEDYRSVDERLLTELGRNPTLEEIAEGLHITPEETAAVAKMLENARFLSRAKQETEAPAEEDPEEAQHVEDTALFQSRQRINDMLSELSEEETRIITLRFGLEGGLPMTPEETGAKLGLTATEVVAKESAALVKMRNA
jgi:RNA polymerase primary sigma factor